MRGAVGFEEFAQAHVPMLLRTATAMCSDPATAEDLVQDVLLKLHRHWTRVAAVSYPEAYLRRMLANEYVSWQRKWSRQVPRGDVELLDGSVADRSVEFSERDALREQLLRLPRQQQILLALRYYADLSDTEIAAALGCSRTTVRGYAHRALTTLRHRVTAAPNNFEEHQR